MWPAAKRSPTSWSHQRRRHSSASSGRRGLVRASLFPTRGSRTAGNRLFREIDWRGIGDPVEAVVRLEHLYRLPRGGVPAWWGAATESADGDEETHQNQGSHRGSALALCERDGPT